MKLLSSADFSLRRVRESGNGTTPLSEIVVKGVSTGKMVDCAILEAAIEWEDLILAFMTDDVPFEEVLSIYLFDQALSVIDSARLGAIYSTGVFSGLALRLPDAVEFKFIGGITWKLKLLREPRFVLPFVSNPTGISRPFGFYRRFLVIGKPLPDDSHGHKKG